MATILATTTIDLSKEQKRKLFNEINTAIVKTFPTPSILFRDIDEEDCTGMCKNQIQIAVCVPPYVQIERRRKLVKDIDDIKLKVKDYLGDVNIIVTFIYHDDEACGVDGVLRADAKAAANK
ncbi:hypothetical protein [Lutispora saccharofermentans]|uniref:Uncharacterized protein n=1 Tax=Lutispora saccharofermentans TaxID=3024236 RepID=A0ABT1NFI8_9FIRM|nr:hypothetical protein [Lutispora saccharofermentans]MCQ1528933.1 hypothetical protein [Lutispora saccharofermentans]